MNLGKAEAWTGAFEAFMSEFDDCFFRQELKDNAKLYVRGLLSDVKRKNGWQLAEAVGLADPHSLQRLLSEAHWDEDELCQRLREEVIGQLGIEPGVGVIDESGFEKKGDKSAGVAKQYCGRLGKVENCQVGVFLGYVSPLGQAFLDRQLYLPEAWCEDEERCKAAKIPAGTEFKTKPELALELLKRSWQEGIAMQWVVADSTYGNSPGLRQAIHDRGRYYVMALGSKHQVLLGNKRIALKEVPNKLAAHDWLEMLHGLGEKGPLAYAWAGIRIRMPHDDIGEQWLLLRRSLDPEDKEIRFYLSNAPDDSKLEDLATVAMARHSIEQLLEDAKGVLGLADYEVRYYPAWHRHMTLCMLAHSFLTLKRSGKKKKSLASLASL